MAADDKEPTGAALLAQLQKKLAGGLRKDPPIFRVVEVARAPNGRLVRQGQIWHSDLDQVRRFGRALAANSVSQQVVIADSAGAVIEEIPVAIAAAGPAGWGGWRDLPLPPAPPRKKPRRIAKPEEAAAAPKAPAAPPVPSVDLPVMQAEVPAEVQAAVPTNVPAEAPAEAEDDLAIVLP